MRKGIFWTGIVILVLATLAYFFGSSVPYVSALSQTSWTVIAVVGLVIAVMGALKRKRRLIRI